MTDPRIHPLLAVPRAELEELVGAAIASVEPVDGGLTNTLHRVVTATGEVLAVKHHAAGAGTCRHELAMLGALAGRLPIPEVVRADERRAAIVYRWIDGITLDDCRRREPPAAFASLAEPLGRLLAWLARTPAPGDWAVGPIVSQARSQLAGGRTRQRLGAPLADAVTAALDAGLDRLAWGATCLAHNDIGGRNILVARADGDRWRIAGVIDWEAASASSPLGDVGSLFRYSQRYDGEFSAAFERGYREAGGTLPERWWLTARLLDATGLVDVLDEDRELPGVFADCRMLLAKLVADVAR